MINLILQVHHVVIDNYPQPSPWYVQWIPIIVAFVSILISTISLYYTRRAFSLNNRPFLWVFIERPIDATDKIWGRLKCVELTTKGHPAKIISLWMRYLVEGETLFERVVGELIIFPEDNIQLNVGSDMAEILDKYMTQNPDVKIYREVKVIYRSFGGIKKYSAEHKQYFHLDHGRWIDVEIKAE